MFKMIGILFLALAAAAGDAHAAGLRGDAPENSRLLKLVVLSRHGVRSPTQSPEELARWASRPWPQWPVGKGELTARGGELLTIQWREMRRILAEEGLLPAQGCPGPEDVLCVADAEQRTRESAAAILKGLVPECGLSAASDPTQVTPLFHPVRARQASLDTQAVRAEMERVLAGLHVPHGALELIQRVTGCCAPGLCDGRTRGCALADIPDTVGFNKGDVKLSGRLAMASSLAEIFLLEYGQWPERNAGWGEVDAEALKTMLPVHNLVFDALNRAPDVAAARGGAMLAAGRTGRACHHLCGARHQHRQYRRPARSALGYPGAGAQRHSSRRSAALYPVGKRVGPTGDPRLLPRSHTGNAACVFSRRGTCHPRRGAALRRRALYAGSLFPADGAGARSA